MDKVTVWLPRPLHKELKLAAVADERDLAAVLEDAVREYLSRRRHASISRVRGDSDKIGEGQE